MADRDTALREVAELVSAVLRYAPAALEAEIRPVANRLGLGTGPGPIEKLLREDGATCRCGISPGAPSEVIPPACPVHGIPCDVCGGVESCTDDCGEVPGDPVGTVTDLSSQAPRTVRRDRDCLVIPALRLDAEGCALLRTIINGEMVDLVSAQEQGARRRTMEALGELVGKLITAPDGEDCGCGLGAERCRAAEDGDFGD